jgi:hypothetical protein
MSERLRYGRPTDQDETMKSPSPLLPPTHYSVHRTVFSSFHLPAHHNRYSRRSDIVQASTFVYPTTAIFHAFNESSETFFFFWLFDSGKRKRHLVADAVVAVVAVSAVDVAESKALLDHVSVAVFFFSTTVTRIFWGRRSVRFREGVEDVREQSSKLHQRSRGRRSRPGRSRERRGGRGQPWRSCH